MNPVACPAGSLLTECLFCSDITDRHRRLAEITEMIHTASLVHDDVLDDCSLRRGKHRRISVILARHLCTYHREFFLSCV